MCRKGKSVEDILDVRGLRLVVPDEKSCYAALEVVRQLWKHIAGKFKDYIVEPKCNGYVYLLLPPSRYNIMICLIWLF